MWKNCDAKTLTNHNYSFCCNSGMSLMMTKKMKGHNILRATSNMNTHQERHVWVYVKQGKIISEHSMLEALRNYTQAAGSN